MADVRLRVLGCGDAFSSGGRFQTSFLLEGGEEPLLVDCGATTLMALKAAEIDPASIGHVAISHLHGDHFGGLPWLIIDGQFAGRERPLIIAGPPGTEQRLKEAFEALYPGSTGSERPFQVEVVELPEREATALGPATVTPFEVIHSCGAPPFALRIEYGGKVIAYSGDTEWTDALLEASDGSDLFVCECNFFEKEVPGHLSYCTIAEKDFGCRRLVLTHLSDDMLAHADDVEAEALSDGAVIELGQDESPRAG